MRAEWGAGVHIEQIKPEGLHRSLLELCKYQVQAITTKSGNAAHASAPGMIDWDPQHWLEWWHANQGFRRTRSYGVLFNVEEKQPEERGELILLGRHQWDRVTRSYATTVSAEARSAVYLILGDKSLSDGARKCRKRLRPGGITPLSASPPQNYLNYVCKPGEVHPGWFEENGIAV
jgi:hypothetical protein